MRSDMIADATSYNAVLTFIDPRMSSTYLLATHGA
jgi:hypothetical protein